MTSIRGWGETILSGGLADNNETERGLKIIIKETKRLAQMVEELLDFSKMEANRLVLIKETTDIKAELKEVIQIFELRARKEGFTLTYRCLADIPLITADKNRLRQVFINILDNAMKFSPSGKTITVEIQKDPQNIKIMFADQGMGMSEEDIQKATEKFYKGNPQKPGSGLGLAICDKIIKSHSGVLSIESKINQGTIVTLLLPQD